jgi:hypothetical protein
MLSLAERGLPGTTSFEYCWWLAWSGVLPSLFRAIDPGGLLPSPPTSLRHESRWPMMGLGLDDHFFYVETAEVGGGCSLPESFLSESARVSARGKVCDLERYIYIHVMYAMQFHVQLFGLIHGELADARRYPLKWTCLKSGRHPHA